MKVHITLLFVSLFIFSCSNRSFKTPHKYIEVSHLNNRINNVLNDDWILIVDGFTTTIFFCPTCNDLDSAMNNQRNAFVFPEERLRLKGPDSVAFLTSVNPPMYQTEEERKIYHQPDGILKITIQYQDTWSDSKHDQARAMNDTLIEALKRKGEDPDRLSSFDDLRANIPDSSSWKRYLSEYNFYFQRLPYKSSLTEKSILLNGELPHDWCYPFYVDKSDPLYYLNNENSMFYEYPRVMYCIAYALGIEDYDYPY